MPHLESNDNNEEPSNRLILSLGADEDANIIFSNLPVFGANLTFREDIADLKNCIVFPNQVIGWIDSSELTKLACLNQHQYFEAQHFIKVERNQLFFSQTVRVHSVNTDLKESKTILTFSVLSIPHMRVETMNQQDS
jgi:hypothetical protein